MDKKHKNDINVLEIINLFGSAKIFIGGQFKYLKQNGVNMHLICSPDDRLEDFAKEQQIKKHQAIEINRQLSIGKDFTALVKICKFIHANKINVLIGHQPKGTLLTVLAGIIMRVPRVILFAHGTFYETETGVRKFLFINLERFLSYFSDQIVCVSNFVVEIRKSLKIDTPDKTVLLGSGTCGGIDTISKFAPRLIEDKKLEVLRNSLKIEQDDFIIGYSGRIVKDKGIIDLLDAFELLEKKHANLSIKLLLVGDSEIRDAIPESYLYLIANNPKIIKTGFVNEEMEYYYSLMSVLILPSYRDGFGLSLIEASAMQIPVIASKITGCRDAVSDGQTGFYTELNPDDITRNIERFFDPVLAKNIGINGRNWIVQNFDHQVIWPHVLKLLKFK
jgi:glycosyltransferase involved in cell wall biosynthesis